MQQVLAVHSSQSGAPTCIMKDNRVLSTLLHKRSIQPVMLLLKVLFTDLHS